ncbi:ArdC family protein [Hyphococcus sp.]|uniref:ArdC family protein n=1 Tax=Hyphococcus sp. TaxID=2038636 RepID=UPI0035C6F393
MTSLTTETPDQAARPQQAGRARNARNETESQGTRAATKNAKTKKTRSGKPKTDLYTEVTDKIVRELEAGRFPWAQPWRARGSLSSNDATIAAGLPKNAQTGRAYSGINILLLWGAAIENGFSGQTWLTFRQAKALGGSVMKGERGAMVVYADKFIPKDEQQRVEKEGGDANFVPFLKRYTVFNAAQCEGLPPELTAGAKPLPECDAIPRAENLIKATGADFRIGGDRAFYVPSQDFIRVPPQPAFFEQINYYRTCFHEIGHWTGHASRLGREFKGRYGSHGYAREELVAELASAFVCASLSITPTVRHADYLGAWLEVLKEDNRAIFNAASLASRAADFILAFENPAPEPQASAMERAA